MTQELAVRQTGSLTSYALPLEEIKAQVNLIQHVMRDVMKDGEHYGTIPGCGDKKVLKKSGSEKIMMTFRLSNDTEVEVLDMPNNHREYRIKCTLFSPDGLRLGTGVGSCSTMEGKYRYRAGTGDVTSVPVPKSYWDARNSGDMQKASKVLKDAAASAGIDGEKFGTKKGEAGWMIATIVDKAEHDNPADYYNTCLKMAKKRALVDATLTTTAASDIFTQDIEDDPDLYRKGGYQPANEETKKEEPALVHDEAKKGNAPVKKEIAAKKDEPQKTNQELRSEAPSPEDIKKFTAAAQAAKTLLTDSEKVGMNNELRAGYTATGIRLATDFLYEVIAKRTVPQPAADVEGEAA